MNRKHYIYQGSLPCGALGRKCKNPRCTSAQREHGGNPCCAQISRGVVTLGAAGHCRQPQLLTHDSNICVGHARAPAWVGVLPRLQPL